MLPPPPQLRTQATQGNHGSEYKDVRGGGETKKAHRQRTVKDKKTKTRGKKKKKKKNTLEA